MSSVNGPEKMQQRRHLQRRPGLCKRSCCCSCTNVRLPRKQLYSSPLLVITLPPQVAIDYNAGLTGALAGLLELVP
jgi:hypothetical protein